MMPVLGLDIGGANLKAADSGGKSISQCFPLWQQPESLADQLVQIRDQFPPVHHIGITMTGELCDCFENKQAGVEAILDSVDQAFSHATIHIYSVDGAFVSVTTARENTLSVAASNWFALAQWIAESIAMPAVDTDQANYQLLVDMGSTSTDLIPLNADKILSVGKSDTQRIENLELVYTGSDRSPVCSFGFEVPFRGQRISLAQEWFATMKDVYLVLGWRKENAADRDTADNRPSTIARARHRLARMVCADPEELNPGELESLAEFIGLRQQGLVQKGIEHIANRLGRLPAKIIMAGSGADIVQRLVDREYKSVSTLQLSDVIGLEASSSGPAFAVCKLLEKHLGEIDS